MIVYSNHCYGSTLFRNIYGVSMSEKLYRKTFNHQFTVTSDGTGYWDMRKDLQVTFHRISIEAVLYDDNKSYGGIWLDHNANANEHGLCYTDNGVTCGVQEEFAMQLSQYNTILDPLSISGSEQGMQSTYIFSCDVNFNDNVTEKKLIDLGFILVD